MSEVKISWDAQGFELDSVGKKKFLRITDGDTPYISMSIRMLSIDTPEVHYPGTQKPSKHDAKLAELAGWLQAGKTNADPGLVAYLYDKLTSKKAGSLQEQQGQRATEEFQKLLDKKLTPSRNLFVRAANEPFDQYGRLLAYISPYYSKQELEGMSYEERATFNLLMVKTGWAASFPIYPSLPKHKDLVMLQEAAKAAFEGKKGAWSNPRALTGYEFRMCYKLWDVTRKLEAGESLSNEGKNSWIERYCADMTTLKLFKPQQYYKVKPYNRVFIWPQDLTEAINRLGLVSVE